MATSDRTTVKATVQALLAEMRAGLVADPPDGEAPFRGIEEGFARYDEYVRPFMTVRILETTAVTAVEGDKIVRVTFDMRLVTDVLSDDPHDAILDAVGAVEDFFDGLLTGEDEIIEGADGFDDRSWSFKYPSGSTGPLAAEASCRQTCLVKVERGYNRVPK